MAAKFLPYLLAGIWVGCLYALIAIGYTMVYGILRLINFAHGDIFIDSRFSDGMYFTPSLWRFPSLWCCCLRYCGASQWKRPPISPCARRRVCRNDLRHRRKLPFAKPGQLRHRRHGPGIPDVPFYTVTVLGRQTKRVTMVTPFLAIALVAALVTVIQKTKIGMAMRAVSRDFETAQLMGIKINNVISITFAVGCFLGGHRLHDVLYQLHAVTPTIGAMPGLKAFVAAVFGGIGSIPGAVIGAFIIGICENLIKAQGYHAVFSNAFTFALLIVILPVKPTGLFGENLTEKCEVPAMEKV